MKKNDVVSFFSDEKFLKSLYKSLLPSFKKMVLENSGSQQDAEDLLQESVILSFKKMSEPDFELTSKLETFIYGIGRRKWMYELRKRSKFSLTVESNDEGNLIDEIIIKSERQDLYLKYFNSMSESCRQILTLFFEGIRMMDIALKLGFKSEGYARKRKHNCQSKLVEAIKNDSLYQELKNG